MSRLAKFSRTAGPFLFTIDVRFHQGRSARIPCASALHTATGDAVADEENGSFADSLSERKQVHRAGDLTLRPSAPWTPAVHALLRHLETVGFAGSPRVVGTGIDAAGREMIQFVADDVAQERVWSEEGIHQLGRMLLEMHEATASFRPPRQAVWQASFLRANGAETVVSHGDVGPWNVVARHGQPAALIDWERPVRSIA